MITRIEIDGFKTFQDFSVDLAPFQVIIGANGCGKSNLFDAIRLLSRLASQDLNSAVQDLRGQPFTLLPGSKLVNRMRISVEMLVDPVVIDQWREMRKLTNLRLRYELVLAYQPSKGSLPELTITHEALRGLSSEEDFWSRNYVGADFHHWLHSAAQPADYIVTEPGKPDEGPTQYIHADPITPDSGRRYYSGGGVRTLLSRVETTELAHILAVRQELQSWEFLHLNPDDLRSTRLTTNNIPSILASMEKVEPRLFQNVSRDLGNLLHDVTGVQVEFNAARNEYEVFLCMTSDRRFGLQGLSDGTLRLLALVTAKNAVKKRGLLCIEEPENAVHPGVLGQLVRFLRGMATDLQDDQSALTGWRQIIVTTHSPQLVSHLDLSANELLFADSATHIIPRKYSLQVTRMFPVRPEKAEGPEDAYGLQRVIEYLNNTDVAAQRGHLSEAFSR